MFPFNTYISCFCEQGNLLSQWRGYAEKGTGVAIGFDAQDLKIGFSNVARLEKVEYDHVSQKAALDKFLCVFLDHYNAAIVNTGIDRDDLEREFVFSILKACNVLYPLFKNSSFNEEQEWRLIAVRPRGVPDTGQKFRVRDARIVPYLELEFWKDFYANMPIKEVIVGPAGDQGIVFLGVAEILNNYGLGSVSITSSSTPFRG